MKNWLETKNGALFSAIFCTAFCLLYVASFLKKGVYATMMYPSFLTNCILFGAFATLAVICWIRWLFWKPGREEFYKKKNPAFWTGMTVFCVFFAGVWLFLFFCFGRNMAAAVCCLWMLACAIACGLRARRQKKD